MAVTSWLPRLRFLAATGAVGVLASLSACSSTPAPATTAQARPWQAARQLVLVVTPDWDASTGRMQTFQQVDGQWQPVREATAVSVGRHGAAWGIGLHPAQGDGPQKREGDGRAPAGVFTLGEAFGYAPARTTAMDYQPMRDTSYCVDVTGSPLYNRIVDSNDVGADAVRESTEPMRRDLHADGDQRYREGFVIQHNPANLDGRGSCIFAHLWKAPGEPTAGCTAMPATVMDGLLDWLDPRQQPVFVLLPAAEYRRLAATWALPAMEPAR